MFVERLGKPLYALQTTSRELQVACVVRARHAGDGFKASPDILSVVGLCCDSDGSKEGCFSGDIF